MQSSIFSNEKQNNFYISDEACNSMSLKNLGLILKALDSISDRPANTEEIQQLYARVALIYDKRCQQAKASIVEKVKRCTDINMI